MGNEHGDSNVSKDVPKEGEPWYFEDLKSKLPLDGSVNWASTQYVIRVFHDARKAVLLSNNLNNEQRSHVNKALGLIEGVDQFVNRNVGNISRLQADYEAMRQDYDSMQKTIGEVNASNMSLEERLGNLTIQLETNRTNLETSREAYEKSQKEANEEIENLKIWRETAERDAEKSRNILELVAKEHDAEKAKLNGNLDNIRKEYWDLDAEKKKLNEDYSQALADKKVAEGNAEGYKSQVELVVNECKSLEVQLKEVQAKVIEIQSQADKKSQALLDYNQALADYQANHSHDDNEHSILESKVDELEVMLNETEKEIELVITEAEQNKKDLEAKVGEYVTLQAERDKIAGDLKVVGGELISYIENHRYNDDEAEGAFMEAETQRNIKDEANQNLIKYQTDHTHDNSEYNILQSQVGELGAKASDAEKARDEAIASAKDSHEQIKKLEKILSNALHTLHIVSRDAYSDLKEHDPYPLE